MLIGFVFGVKSPRTKLACPPECVLIRLIALHLSIETAFILLYFVLLLRPITPTLRIIYRLTTASGSRPFGSVTGYWTFNPAVRVQIPRNA